MDKRDATCGTALRLDEQAMPCRSCGVIGAESGVSDVAVAAGPRRTRVGPDEGAGGVVFGVGGTDGERGGGENLEALAMVTRAAAR